MLQLLSRQRTAPRRTIRLKLSDRNEDTVFAHDDFEAYTVGSNITSALWSTNNNTTNGTMGAVDPLDETNQVGKFYNLTGGTQNQQLNRYLGGINTEPVIVKGRYLNRIFLPAPLQRLLYEETAQMELSLLNLRQTGIS